MSGQSNLDSAAYRRAAARLKRTADPICARCGGWIDKQLPVTDRMSWTADHVVSLASGGDELGVLVPMHRACNASKGSGIPRESRQREPMKHPSESRRRGAST